MVGGQETKTEGEGRGTALKKVGSGSGRTTSYFS